MGERRELVRQCPQRSGKEGSQAPRPQVHLVPNLKTDNEIHHERELICFQNLLRLSFSVGENGRICLKADKNCLTVQNRKKEKCRKRAHLELRVSPTHTGILTNFSEIL